MSRIRAGFGYDIHKLVQGRKLVLGGVEIPYEKGLLGHSDADVLTHAVMDALLGAAGLGDIGRYFPERDERYKDIPSLYLLEEVNEELREKGYRVGNIDVTVLAEAPKISGFTDQMKFNLSKALQIPQDCINIKATTTESLGAVGRGEGIAAYASATVKGGSKWKIRMGM